MKARLCYSLPSWGGGWGWRRGWNNLMGKNWGKPTSACAWDVGDPPRRAAANVSAYRTSFDCCINSRGWEQQTVWFKELWREWTYKGFSGPCIQTAAHAPYVDHLLKKLTSEWNKSNYWWLLHYKWIVPQFIRTDVKLPCIWLLSCHIASTDWNFSLEINTQLPQIKQPLGTRGFYSFSNWEKALSYHSSRKKSFWPLELAFTVAYFLK